MRHHLRTLPLFIAAIVPWPVAASPTPPTATVWFDQPAKAFHESCVTGNGRLGAMDLGGVDRERAILNESSVWSAALQLFSRSPSRTLAPHAHQP